MRPEALRSAGRVGLTGVCAAVGISVLAMSAAAQSPASPGVASKATHNKAFTQRLAEAYSEDSLAAPEEPAASGVKPVAPAAVVPPAPAPAAVPTANAPAPSPQTGPETVRAEDLKAANQAADPSKTAYSHRKGTFGDKTAPQAAAAPAKPIPDNMVVVCQAGCEQQPGVMVLFKPVDPAIHLGPQATKRANPTAPPTTALTCVAGCFDTPQTYAGIPTGPHGLAAGASEGRMVPASAQAPSNKALSGDWMVRINRERVNDTKK